MIISSNFLNNTRSLVLKNPNNKHFSNIPTSKRQDSFVSSKSNILRDDSKTSSFLKGLKKVSFMGWKPEKQESVNDINQIVEVIKNPDNQKIAISGHVSPDGDCIGAGLALAKMIHQTTGKKVDYFVFGDLSPKYNFLNENEDVNIINVYTNKEYKPEKLKEKYGQYDVAIAIDVALKRLIQENYFDGIFSQAKTTMRIDHHPYMKTMDKDLGYEVDNNFADYNYSDTDCDSASQIVMQFAEAFGLNPEEITKETNEAIYTGIVTDTDNLKYAQSERPFLDMALLLKNGVNNIDMQSKLVGNTPFCIHKIRQHMYDNVQFTPDNKIAYFVETEELSKLKAEAKEAGCKDEAQSEIANFIESLIKIQGVEIALKVVGTNFSVRSKNADISQLAMKYGGGGHKNASAFCVKKEKSTPAEVVIERIIQEYQEELNSQNIE